MRVIYKPRRCGKTHDLIKLCAENNYRMVVLSAQEKKRVLAEAQLMGLEILEPHTFDEFLSGIFLNGKLDKGMVIDNADHLLCKLNSSHTPIVAISINENE